MNNLHMKTNGLDKIIKILIAVGMVTACDTPSALLVNDVPTYCISSKCGAVKITGTTLVNDRITLNFTGDFIVNVDSLKIKVNHVSIENKNVDILYRNMLLEDANRTIHIDDNDSISLIIKNTFPIQYGKNSFVEIMPSPFILCNDTPLITNAIRIKKHRK